MKKRLVAVIETKNFGQGEAQRAFEELLVQFDANAVILAFEVSDEPEEEPAVMFGELRAGEHFEFVGGRRHLGECVRLSTYHFKIASEAPKKELWENFKTTRKAMVRRVKGAHDER